MNMESGDASLRVKCEACGATFKMTVRGARLRTESVPCPKCETSLDLKSQWEAHQQRVKKASVPMAGVVTRKRKATPGTVDVEKPGGLGFHIERQAGREVVSESPGNGSALGRFAPATEKNSDGNVRENDSHESAELPAVVSQSAEEDETRLVPITDIETLLPAAKDNDGKSPEPSEMRPSSLVEPDSDATVQQDLESLLTELNYGGIDPFEGGDESVASSWKEDATEQISASQHAELLRVARERRNREGTPESDPMVESSLEAVTMPELDHAGEYVGEETEPILESPEDDSPVDTVRDQAPLREHRVEAPVDDSHEPFEDPREDPGYQLDSSEGDENWVWHEEADERDFNDEQPVKRSKRGIGLAIALVFCAIVVALIVVFLTG